MSKFTSKNIQYKLTNLKRNILFPFRKIYWFFQRGLKGYSDWDASEIPSKSLEVLAGLVNTYTYKLLPLDRGYPTNYSSYKEWEEICQETAEKLQRAFLFETGTFIYPDNFDNWTRDQQSEWYRAEEKNVEEALQMFIEHYQGMWT